MERVLRPHPLPPGPGVIWSVLRNSAYAADHPTLCGLCVGVCPLHNLRTKSASPGGRGNPSPTQPCRYGNTHPSRRPRRRRPTGRGRLHNTTRQPPPREPPTPCSAPPATSPPAAPRRRQSGRRARRTGRRGCRAARPCARRRGPRASSARRPGRSRARPRRARPRRPAGERVAVADRLALGEVRRIRRSFMASWRPRSSAMRISRWASNVLPRARARSGSRAPRRRRARRCVAAGLGLLDGRAVLGGEGLGERALPRGAAPPGRARTRAT